MVRGFLARQRANSSWGGHAVVILGHSWGTWSLALTGPYGPVRHTIRVPFVYAHPRIAELFTQYLSNRDCLEIRGSAMNLGPRDDPP